MVTKTKETIAVNKLQAIGISEDEAEVLTSKLRSELMNVAGFKVLERGQMEEILKEQGFQQSGACTEQQCVVEIGQLLGVSHMVAGSIGKVGNTFSVNVRIFSVKSGEINREVAHTYKGNIDGLLQTELTTVVKKLARMEVKPEKKDYKWMWVVGGVTTVGVLTYFYFSRSVKPDENTEKTAADLNLEW
jgi:TolB-like protein